MGFVSRSAALSRYGSDECLDSGLRLSAGDVVNATTLDCQNMSVMFYFLHLIDSEESQA